MRIFLRLIAVLCAAGAVYVFYVGQKGAAPTLVGAPTTVPTKKASITSRSIFVPYWSDFEALQQSYDRYIYFGIAPTTLGINEQEEGYANLDSFVSNVPAGGSTMLTLRMTNPAQTMVILRNKGSWDPIIQKTLDIAEDYKFDGVVLDLEIGASPLTDVSSEITQLVSFFYTNTKGRNLHFAITVYGDTIYRHRPYDLKNLSLHADEVMIMAYDFHKVAGEPGPNFPLSGRETYGYDFQTMLRDFAGLIPTAKMNVIFGMYGYDWIVSEDKKPFGPATAITQRQAQDKFLKSCTLENCVVRRDKASSETVIEYVDNEAFGQSNIAAFHIIWINDEISVEQKIDHMLERGIDKVTYWAWGYF